MEVSLPRLSSDHIQRRGSALAMLMALAAVLQLAAGTGLAYVAGFSGVRAVLGNFHPVWLVALVGALGISWSPSGSRSGTGTGSAAGRAGAGLSVTSWSPFT